MLMLIRLLADYLLFDLFGLPFAGYLFYSYVFLFAFIFRSVYG